MVEALTLGSQNESKHIPGDVEKTKQGFIIFAFIRHFRGGFMTTVLGRPNMEDAVKFAAFDGSMTIALGCRPLLRFSRLGQASESTAELMWESISTGVDTKINNIRVSLKA